MSVMQSFAQAVQSIFNTVNVGGNLVTNLLSSVDNLATIGASKVNLLKIEHDHKSQVQLVDELMLWEQEQRVETIKRFDKTDAFLKNNVSLSNVVTELRARKLAELFPSTKE